MNKILATLLILFFVVIIAELFFIYNQSEKTEKNSFINNLYPEVFRTVKKNPTLGKEPAVEIVTTQVPFDPRKVEQLFADRELFFTLMKQQQAKQPPEMGQIGVVIKGTIGSIQAPENSADPLKLQLTLDSGRVAELIFDSQDQRKILVGLKVGDEYREYSLNKLKRGDLVWIEASFETRQAQNYEEGLKTIRIMKLEQ